MLEDILLIAAVAVFCFAVGLAVGYFFIGGNKNE